MTITIEIDGRKVEAETEKDARKALRKMIAQEKKESAERQQKYDAAKCKAESSAYRVLSRKMSGENYPCSGWRYYPVGHKWAEHLFKPATDKRHTHYLNSRHSDKWVEYDHYGCNIIGAVCDGAGFCFLIFLQDDHRPETIECYAIGAQDEQLALALCPGILPSEFKISE